jgi:hypothetical protein
MGQEPWRFSQTTILSHWLGCVLLSLLLVGLPMSVRGQTPPESKVVEIVRILAREKSVAEQFARLFSDQLHSNATRNVRGIQLYSLAKAEFDGLIEQMKFAFQIREPPDTSRSFQAALQSAVDARVNFTDFVNDNILAKQPPGTRSPVADVIKGASELIKVISDAVWVAWNSTETTKREIITQLDTYKWRSFDDIAEKK